MNAFWLHDEAHCAAVADGLFRYALDRSRRVSGHGEQRLLRADQPAQSFEFGPPDDIVRDQNILHAGIGHSLGLAQLLADNADGAGVHLQARYLRGLVGLGVHPQADIQLVAVGLHVGDVLLQHVQVDDQGRSIEFGEVHGRGYLLPSKTSM